MHEDHNSHGEEEYPRHELVLVPGQLVADVVHDVGELGQRSIYVKEHTDDARTRRGAPAVRIQHG